MNLGIHNVRSARAYNYAVDVAEKAQKCVLKDFEPGFLNNCKEAKNLKRKGNFVVKFLDFFTKVRKNIHVNPAFTEAQVLSTKDNNIIFKLFRSRNFYPDEDIKVVMDKNTNLITDFTKYVGETKKKVIFDNQSKIERVEYAYLDDSPIKTVFYDDGHKRVANAKIQL